MADVYKIERFSGVELSEDKTRISITFVSDGNIYHHVFRKTSWPGINVDCFISAEITNNKKRLEFGFRTAGCAYPQSINEGEFLEGTHVMKLDDPVETFVDYVFEFYGPYGLYPIEGCTKDVILQATKDYMKYEELIGDSVDREKIRDLLPNFIK